MSGSLLKNPIPVRYDDGIHLPEPDAWLDPHGAKGRAFISHAHADHFAEHGETVCSEATRALLVRRFGLPENSVHAYPWDEPFEFAPGHTGRLLPAGHILGSAQLHLTRESDGQTLLYTGDYKLREDLSSEETRFLPSDTLIMETTFGLPKYAFPPTSEVIADILKFTHEALEDGDVPILLGYSLGKAQEILAHLADQNLSVMVHPAVFKMTDVYRDVNPSLAFPTITEFDPKKTAGHVLVFPPNAVRSQVVRRIKNRRTAMLTGWALNPSAKFRYQVDVCFPLSDHADYPDLLRTVEQVAPKRVFTVHGSTQEFAADLRARGTEAWSLISTDQLELGFAQTAPTIPTSAPIAAPEGEFGTFAELGESLAAITGRLRKIELLSTYLRSLTDDTTLALAATFLSGRTFSRESESRATGTGWAVIKRALLAASGLTETRYREISASVNDSGRTTRLILEQSPPESPKAFSLQDVADLFASLRDARGPAAKTALLEATFTTAHPVAASYIVKILGGDLRIGLKEGLLEEAIADAFDAPAKDVREAAMLTGDPARTAILARASSLSEAGLTPFVPLKVMLASPEETAADIAARFPENSPVWLEDKFDGIRAQLHVGEDHQAQLFSRDLRPLTDEFPEFATVPLPPGTILDGELIAYAAGKRLTFFDLQKRLGRKRAPAADQLGDLFLGESVPVKFVAFDCLLAENRPLLDKPLTQRRKILETLTFPENIETAEVHHVTGEQEIEDAFQAARKRLNEGLIAKDPASTYSPGRRGKAWLKLKKAAPTLDCVVTRAQRGHGKRSHVLSDYTFAIRDERSGALATIGKAYSGLTDIEIEELTEHFLKTTLSKARNVHEVEPDTVLEIAFDSINPSKRHDSGLALRFPRIKAIRRDKTPEEIDTLTYARKLAGV